jgi:Zn finger protein HypA/HybF involved in hydrogenase expression
MLCYGGVMAKRRKKRKSKRVCLRCDREFQSDGIYNRICPNCQESNANIAIHQAEPVSELSLADIEQSVNGLKTNKKIIY